MTGCRIKRQQDRWSWILSARQPRRRNGLKSSRTSASDMQTVERRLRFSASLLRWRTLGVSVTLSSPKRCYSSLSLSDYLVLYQYHWAYQRRAVPAFSTTSAFLACTASMPAGDPTTPCKPLRMLAISAHKASAFDTLAASRFKLWGLRPTNQQPNLRADVRCQRRDHWRRQPYEYRDGVVAAVRCPDAAAGIDGDARRRAQRAEARAA